MDFPSDAKEPLEVPMKYDHGPKIRQHQSLHLLPPDAKEPLRTQMKCNYDLKKPPQKTLEPIDIVALGGLGGPRQESTYIGVHVCSKCKIEASEQFSLVCLRALTTDYCTGPQGRAGIRHESGFHC